MIQLSDSQRAFLREATDRYHKALPGSPGEDYLASRGLTLNRVENFLLGYVADPLPGHEMFKGFLAIPYVRWSQDQVWSIVSIRFRCIADHDHRGHGKYMTTPGDRPRLYNTLALLKDSPRIAITEGEIDAITAQASGIPAVGVPGAQAWQEYFKEPFLGYKQVFVLADGDEAGMSFANTVASSMSNARVIPSPEGMDVNSFVLERGPKALIERLK